MPRASAPDFLGQLLMGNFGSCSWLGTKAPNRRSPAEFGMAINLPPGFSNGEVEVGHVPLGMLIRIPVEVVEVTGGRHR